MYSTQTCSLCETSVKKQWSTQGVALSVKFIPVITSHALTLPRQSTFHSLVFHSRVFHPCRLVPRFPLPRFQRPLHVTTVYLQAVFNPAKMFCNIFAIFLQMF